jgi:hypothetical protein
VIRHLFCMLFHSLPAPGRCGRRTAMPSFPHSTETRTFRYDFCFVIMVWFFGVVSAAFPISCFCCIF